MPINRKFDNPVQEMGDVMSLVQSVESFLNEHGFEFREVNTMFACHGVSHDAYLHRGNYRINIVVEKTGKIG